MVSASEWFRQFAARHNANRHLRAYVFTRNPRHILDAMTAFVRAGVVPDENMRRNWEFYLQAKSPRRRTAKHVLRDLDIRRAVLIRYDTSEIPKKLDGKFLHDLAQRHALNVGQLKTIITRMRQSRPRGAQRFPSLAKARKVTFGR